MEEILPGLYHWTTKHPNLGEPVSSYYVTDSAALLDPMVPDDGLSAFDDLPRPKHVVLTCRHHDRDHAEFVEAFGCSFHVSERGVHEYEGEAVEPYAIGDEPAPGIRAIANGPIAPDDMVLLIDVEGHALAFADSLTHDDASGELAFVPDSLLGDDPDQVKADISGALHELLGQRFEHVLFAHGPPIVGGGREALERFVSRQNIAG
jgi:hypothetical protein